MEKVMDIINYILGLGPTVIIPIAIFIIALFFKVKIGRAFTSAITIGIGFVGINLVIGLLSSELGKATDAMVHNFNFSLTVTDMGWPIAASGAFASPVAPIMIVLALVINFIMLAVKWTDTLNIDIWNFHHLIAVAALSYIVTGNVWFSCLLGAVAVIYTLKFADIFAKMFQDYYGLEGITITTGSSIAYATIGLPIAYIIGKIPVIKDIEIDSETVQRRFGIFGEPLFMGLIIGFVLGLLAAYDIGSAFKLGVSVAAVMILMPRMVKILMEGLIPISEAAQEFASTRYADREINIGLDSALAIGDPNNMAAGLIMVPIALLLAVVVPGNRMLPLGDLATIPFYTCFITASRKGNILHTVITTTIVLVFALWMATNMAPEHTMLVQGVGEASNITGQISSFDTGGNFVKWIAVVISRLFASIS